MPLCSKPIYQYNWSVFENLKKKKKKSHELRVNDTKIAIENASNQDGFGFGNNKESGYEE